MARPARSAPGWAAGPLTALAWAHVRVRTAGRRFALVAGGAGTVLREVSAVLLFVLLWMVTFGLMWGMVAVLVSTLAEQALNLALPAEAELQTDLVIWVWAACLIAYPLRWLVVRLVALRHQTSRSAVARLAAGPLLAWADRWRLAGEDSTFDGAAAVGMKAALEADRRAGEAALEDERRRWQAERRRPPGTPALPAPVAAPPLPVRHGRSGGWVFGPPQAVPEGPMLTIEPFVGYRRWVVRPGSVVGGDPWEPVLGSAVIDYVWVEADVEARCWPGRRSRFDPLAPTTHTAPSLDCRCGIYALKDPASLDWPLDGGLCVEGAVELSGTVLEGERGYRGQRARVVGPIEMVAACEHGLRRRPVRELCGSPPRLAVVRPDRYALACDRHAASLIVANAEPVDLAVLVSALAARLEARYGVAVIMERGGLPWT
jgi:hypothetical protein